jgi:hypothetical protein
MLRRGDVCAGLLRVHPIGGGLRLTGGGEDGAWIVLQGLE